MDDLSSPAEISIPSPPSPDFMTLHDSSCDDACSICLESFSSQDPATVTNCKHEYHLQCILEWSQRSKECPICWQLLVLKDPVSQELLDAVGKERSARSRPRSSNASTFSRIPLEDFEFHNVPSYDDDSDFDEHIMQHLAATAMGRARHFSRRERHRTSGLTRSQLLVFADPSNDPEIQQTPILNPAENNDSGNLPSPEGDSPTATLSPAEDVQSQASVPLSHGLGIAEDRHSPFSPRILASQTPPGSPQRSRQSELLSFSESLKSKLSAASSRYKETFSKSTRGLKEKLLSRNNSVKELSKEVQREVTASIAGVARMIERLDPSSKKTGSFSPVPDGIEGTSESSPNGKGVQENMISQSPNKNCGEDAQGTSSSGPLHGSSTLSSGSEGHLGVAQELN
ncbi:E3 ubiquitin-protein ligase RHF1A-like [Tasmannia lanceolata]|uniref:E3 ubiquitin-protein ligase RHF1A-like n=1 Tax=Tasmannia lanceolata TaxID=3420 RepID=UPI004063EB83